jgi:hypothetical protein
VCEILYGPGPLPVSVADSDLLLTGFSDFFILPDKRGLPNGDFGPFGPALDAIRLAPGGLVLTRT